MSTTALANRDNQALAMNGSSGATSWDVMIAQAGVLVRSGFLPDAIKTAEQAVAIILAGEELGIPKMLALRSIHIIKGTPTLSADLMAALVHREIDRHKDGEFTVLSPSATECTVRYRRWGAAETHEFTYTIAMATTAQLAGSETWRKHPHAMLKARATSTACRMAFPDVIAGLYAPEEMIDDIEAAAPAPLRVLSVSEGVPRNAGSEPVQDTESRAEAIDAETGEITAHPPESKKTVLADITRYTQELGWTDADALNYAAGQGIALRNRAGILALRDALKSLVDTTSSDEDANGTEGVDWEPVQDALTNVEGRPAGEPGNDRHTNA